MEKDLVFYLKSSYEVNKIDSSMENALDVLLEKAAKYGCPSRTALFTVGSKKKNPGIETKIPNYEPISFTRKNDGGDAYRYVIKYVVKDKYTEILKFYELERNLSDQDFKNYNSIKNGFIDYNPLSDKPYQRVYKEFLRIKDFL